MIKNHSTFIVSDSEIIGNHNRITGNNNSVVGNHNRTNGQNNVTVGDFNIGSINVIHNEIQNIRHIQSDNHDNHKFNDKFKIQCCSSHHDEHNIPHENAVDKINKHGINKYTITFKNGGYIKIDGYSSEISRVSGVSITNGKVFINGKEIILDDVKSDNQNNEIKSDGVKHVTNSNVEFVNHQDYK